MSQISNLNVGGNAPQEVIRLGVSHVELANCLTNNEIEVTLWRKIYYAALTAAVRPWRQVLNTDTE